MTVWVVETNLFWSARLMQSLRGLGHAAETVPGLPERAVAGDVAILNLAQPGVAAIAAELQARGVRTIGHAGHKEKDLLALGREAGIARLATNSELTYKIAELLAEA